MKIYESYKKTNIPWLDEVPSHWEVKRGKQIFENKKQLNKHNDCINVLSLTLKGVIDNNREKPIGLSPKDYATYQLFDKNDLVFKLIDLENFKTSRVGLVRKKGIMSSAYIRLTQRKEINVKYFYFQYYDLYIRAVFNGLGAGVRSTMSASDLTEINIVIPPCTEQDQIVRYLDWKISKINKLVQTKKRQIELLKEQKQAVINKAVTKGLDDSVPMKDSGVEWLGKVPEHWEVNRLKNGCSMINRGVTPRYTEDDKIAMVVNQATFSKGYWDISKVRYTLTSPLETRGLLNYNDVLLASTGGGILGKVFHYSEDGTYIADSHVTIIRCNEKLNSKYVYYNFSTKYELINALLAQGSTNQTELQRDWLVAFHFPFPPLEEQQAIVYYITDITGKIDTVIRETEKEIELLSEYKTSLISSVVTGKVDLRDVIVPEFTVVEDVMEDLECDEDEKEET